MTSQQQQLFPTPPPARRYPDCGRTYSARVTICPRCGTLLERPTWKPTRGPGDLPESY